MPSRFANCQPRVLTLALALAACAQPRPSARTSEPLASAAPGVVPANPNELTEISIRVIRNGVQQWQATNEVTSCPTMSELQRELHVDRSESGLDPWGHPYTFVCADDEVTVSSDGADGVHGTPDDITVPRTPVAP